MRSYFYIFIFFYSQIIVAQIVDPLMEKTDKYWEDQLYTSITYNVLNNQPENVSSSGFSFGGAFGYIKDVPFNHTGTLAVGVGLGYAFDSFNYGMHFDSNELVSLSNGARDRLFLHSLEVPIQFRWRNSSALTYSFWRVYIGSRLGYNFYNSFISDTDKLKNSSVYDRFQTGLEFSVGYKTLNFYVYYGLKPIFKDLILNNEVVDTRITKFGLIFYLL